MDLNPTDVRAAPVNLDPEYSLYYIILNFSLAHLKTF